MVVSSISQGSPARARTPLDRLAPYAAPAAAIAAGIAAQWLDFRELRYALLAMVFLGVLLTAAAATRGRTGAGQFVASVLIGMATWGAAQTLYVVMHASLGERFEADRFGTQPAQAVGLIAAHALFLGAPTGVAAGVVLAALDRARRGGNAAH